MEYDVPEIGDICWYFDRDKECTVSKIMITRVSSSTVGSSLPMEFKNLTTGETSGTNFIPPSNMQDNPTMIDNYDCIYDKRYYFRKIENIVKSLFEMPTNRWDTLFR